MLPAVAISKAIRHAAYLIASGHPEETAAILAASHYHLCALEVQAAWRTSRRRYKARETHARRLIAVLLAKNGWSNKRSADLLGVHPKHVRRMRLALKSEP